MPSLGLETHVVDPQVYENTVRRFAERNILLPTFAQLAAPETIPTGVQTALETVDPDAPDPLNLFRVHWNMASDRRRTTPLPDHLVLPSSLTGVEAPIVVLIGANFPMIHAHKVLAAYGCLAPRVITGQFDPTTHRAVWPSTGNYCRGGVAISRIMACRGVAVLPEGMSAERFQWLERWVSAPEDVIRTPGTESNVKEIYDKCHELDEDPHNIIFNQFSEFGNHLAHYVCTGRAAATVFEALHAGNESLRLRAFVSATGSAGTLGAGDLLKERYGSLNVAVEALECPTLLYNGFGEHNIQGIGDKHVPLIHNVMSTDVVTAVSDRATDALDVLFNSPAGREYLIRRRHVPEELVERLPMFGLSSICNVLASIKLARYHRMGPDDVLVTVATDPAALYDSERTKTLAREFQGEFDAVDAGECYGRYVLGLGADHLLELSQRDRERIFDLGYYTWVEQQGISLEAFVERRRPAFWRGLHALLDAWDEAIVEFNERTGVTPKPRT
jgi:cysteine synthase